MQTRRAFLRILGAGVGAALLPACGGNGAMGGDGGGGMDGGGGGDMPPLPSPNGYLVSPIVSLGDMLPGGGTIKQLIAHYQWLAPGSGMPSLMFQAVDNHDKTGIYEFPVDVTGGIAKVMNPRAVLRQGDTMTDAGDTIPNGRNASHHTIWDANSAGSTLVVVQSEGKPPAVYLDRQRMGFKHVLSQSTAAGTAKFAARLGHVILGDNHDLLVVAGYHPGADNTDKRGGHTRTGLFHLPNADVTKATLLVATGDPVPGGTIANLGMPTIGPDNAYAIQAGVRDGGGTIISQVFTGKIGDPMSLTGQQATGERAFFHARLDGNGDLAQVVHLSKRDMQLRFGGKTLLKTGDKSPGGNTILSLHPPVFAKGSTMLFQLGTDGPMELVLWDGMSQKTVLAAMDGIGGKAVQLFMFGTFPRQADGMNRFVVLVDFGADGQSIMLATPV